MILAGKRLLITGVITKDSIAFHAAEQAQREGANVVLTSFGRVRRLTERAAQRLPEPADVLELDVNRDDDLSAVAGSLRERWGGVDGVLHAIAFAPEDAIGGRFMTGQPLTRRIRSRQPGTPAAPQGPATCQELPRQSPAPTAVL